MHESETSENVAVAVEMREWLGTESDVGAAVERFSRDTLNVYKADDRRVTEDANIERVAIEGGYARRQLFELVQNGADELIDTRGRIAVVRTANALYCANQGNPISVRGVGALLSSNFSPKTGVEIGRFGLGFKSVLGITTQPALFSRTGSFQFDRTYNEARVRRVLPDANRVATLRIARPLDPRAEAEQDPVLAELMEWAMTVVKCPLDIEGITWLGAHLEEFPAQFLLFATHVADLCLDDRVESRTRRITLAKEKDGVWALQEAGTSTSVSRWRVFGKIHQPSTQARKDAGSLAERPEIPINWAVPLDRAPIGEFWAFFPTDDRTTLSGIANAPWKLTENRLSLISGAFNDELLHELGDLVVENYEAFHSADDPGYVLDVLPARGKELRSNADGVVSERIFDELPLRASLPDQRGKLQLPAGLRGHPELDKLREQDRRNLIEVWSQQPTAPRAWVHPRAYSTATRAARVERLIRAVGARPESIKDWLAALIPKAKQASGSACAVQVAALLAYTEHDADMRSARIVLTAEGKLVPPKRGVVWLPSDVSADLDVTLVHPDVAADPAARAAFKKLGIEEVAPATLLNALLDRADFRRPDADWTEVWKHVKKAGPEAARRVLLHDHGLEAGDINVRTMAGTWERLSVVLMPGGLVPVMDVPPEHRSMFLDIDYHRGDLELLKAAGATDRPVTGRSSMHEPWCSEYKQEQIEGAIEEARRAGFALHKNVFEFEDEPSFGGPALPLRSLKGEAGANYAAELLNVTPDLEPWKLKQGMIGKPRAVDHPLIWLVKKHGFLPSNHGVQPIGVCVTEFLRGMEGLLPVARVSRSAARALQLPDTPAELQEAHWTAAFATAGALDREDLLGHAYIRLARGGAEPPAQLRCIVKREALTLPASEVCAGVTAQDVKVLRETGKPFIRVPDEESAAFLVGSWHLRSVTETVSSRLVFQEAGEREPLVDRFPLLGQLFLGDVEDWELVPCSEIRREMFTDGGSVPELLRFELHDGLVLRSTELADADVLRRIGERLGSPLDEDAITAILDDAFEGEVELLMKKSREGADDPARLLLLVGAEELRTRLPKTLVDAVEEREGELGDRAVAELALTVFGIETLKEYSEVLRQRGLRPPRAWAGSRAAKRFVVTDLGFEPKFAGFAGVKLEQQLEVPGRAKLPPLHEFQKVSGAEIRRLLRGEGGLRGLLSLPTGAGKTRVAVQALTEAMAAGELAGPILWVAQSEELCEQAVQSWAEVWRAVGPDEGLRISRLWAHHTAAPRDDDGFQVVVATIQKLGTSLLASPQFKWLRDCQAVIIDEAHGSTATGYTELLRQLEMSHGKERVPLIGLSATPFRGISDTETEQLVNRYNRRRLDKAAFADEVSIKLLQRMGILAEVEHHILEGSENVPLTKAELAEIEKMRRLPASVLARITGDIDRTNRLVERIMQMDPEWPILVFATSLDHSQTLAALLERQGRSAASISGETPTSARRHYVREFKAGRLRTLTNYGVFTQGFDAPSIRALFIARPTYSPNLYQQMVGRGLRGPLNGGKEKCLVVDVADNLTNYGGQLAFREFEHLWTA